MKLTSRGNAYEIPTSIQCGSDSMDQPKIKLIYRDHKYYITPHLAVFAEVVEQGEQQATLIYRGNTYERKLPLTFQAKPLHMRQTWLPTIP